MVTKSIPSLIGYQVGPSYPTTGHIYVHGVPSGFRVTCDDDASPGGRLGAPLRDSATSPVGTCSVPQPPRPPRRVPPRTRPASPAHACPGPSRPPPPPPPAAPDPVHHLAAGHHQRLDPAATPGPPVTPPPRPPPPTASGATNDTTAAGEQLAAGHGVVVGLGGSSGSGGTVAIVLVIFVVAAAGGATMLVMSRRSASTATAASSATPTPRPGPRRHARLVNATVLALVASAVFLVRLLPQPIRLARTGQRRRGVGPGRPDLGADHHRAGWPTGCGPACRWCGACRWWRSSPGIWTVVLLRRETTRSGRGRGRFVAGRAGGGGARRRCSPRCWPPGCWSPRARRW